VISYYSQKNVFLFGASQGIGLEAACQLAQQGAHVHIFARRESVLQEAKEKIIAHKLGEAEQRIDYTPADVTDADKLVEQIDQLVQEWGCPDIVINCAGQARPNYFENITAQQFEQTLKLNVIGVRNIVAAVLPHMRKQTGGHIVNTSSIAGFIGVFGYTDYSASKFAIVGFSEALQAEVKKDNIQVSILYPPDTYTEGFEEEEKTKPKETRAVSGNNKPVTPDVVAKALVKQLPKRKFHIIPNFDSRLSHVIKRWWPSLVTWIMDRDIKKAQQ